MIRHFVSILRANVSKTGNSNPDIVSSSDIYKCGKHCMIVRYCESDRHNTPAIFELLQRKTCCRLWEQHRFDMIVRLVFHTEITYRTSKSRALHNYYAYKSHEKHPSRMISVDTYKSSPLVNKI